MANFGNFKIKWETRLCMVGERTGYFHTWEQFSKPVAASPIKGGPPAGVISEVFAIVEFETGIERVKAHEIKFCDETHGELVAYNEFLNEYKEQAKKKENNNESLSE